MSDRFPDAPSHPSLQRGGITESTRAISAAGDRPAPSKEMGCKQFAGELSANLSEQRMRLRNILDLLRGPSDENEAEGPTGPGLISELEYTQNLALQNLRLTSDIARILGMKL